MKLAFALRSILFLKKIFWFYAQSMCEFVDGVNRSTLLTSFDGADVGAVDVALEGKLFLRKRLQCSEGCKPSTKAYIVF